MDTPGLLARDLEIFPNALQVLRDSGGSEPDYAPADSLEILYPIDFLPADDPTQLKAMDEFLKDLSSSTCSVLRQISIHEDWQKSAPVEEKDLHQYLYNVRCPGGTQKMERSLPLAMAQMTQDGWYYSAYNTFARFRAVYEKAHGHSPFVTEVVRMYWYGTLSLTLVARHLQVGHIQGTREPSQPREAQRDSESSLYLSIMVLAELHGQRISQDADCTAYRHRTTKIP
jgi:hypothetical protein